MEASTVNTAHYLPGSRDIPVLQSYRSLTTPARCWTIKTEVRTHSWAQSLRKSGNGLCNAFSVRNQSLCSSVASCRNTGQSLTFSFPVCSGSSYCKYRLELVFCQHVSEMVAQHNNTLINTFYESPCLPLSFLNRHTPQLTCLDVLDAVSEYFHRLVSFLF